MTASVSFNPYVQTSGNNGLFNTTSTGFRQGTAMPDPAKRFALKAGILATTETLPMWGGVGIYADIPGSPTGAMTGPRSPLGAIIGRAVSLTDTVKPLLGFSVSDEAYGMITSPQSTVPLAGSGMQVNYYLLGSGARIAVQCDPIIVNLRGDPLNQPVSWDFTDQLLVPFLGTQTITSGTYNNTTGLVSLTMAATQSFDAGDSITLASLTGTGAFAGLAGTWTSTLVNGTNVQFIAPAGLGASAITGGNLTVGGAASQQLKVNILDIQSTNCEVVVYAPATGFATYNYNGAAALIQI